MKFLYMIFRNDAEADLNTAALEMVYSNSRKITDKLYECENQFNGMLYESYNDTESQLKLNTCEETSDVKQDETQNFKVLESKNSDYQELPGKYFNYEGVTPPLVRTSWLELFTGENEESFDINNESCRATWDTDNGDDDDDGNSVEDSIPLSDLKLKLSHQDICDIKNDTNNTGVAVIQRKRGRPRKQTQTSGCDNADTSNNYCDFLEEADLNEDSQDDCADWWDKNIDLGNLSDLYIKNEENNDISNCEVKAFYEVGEEENAEVKNKKLSNKKRVKKGDVNNETGGIKMDNSKVIFPCMECGKTFSAASTLKYHLRIHNGTLIKCPECDRGFTTNYLLKCHMRTHTGDLFMCHKCGKGFTTAELLKVHSRSHTGVRPFRCDICGKSFPSASNLTQHKETHEPEKKYLCFQCGSSFSQKRCLDGHMLSHGEKNHICTVCGKLWARKSDLTEHMRVHTGYKPYACHNCPQKFTQGSSLRRHQIVHMDANPIQCLVCGKMLKCNDYYKRHMKKHMKEQKQQMTDFESAETRV